MGGDILFRWGNPAAYRRGTATDQEQFGQHDGQWIPPGYPGEGNVDVDPMFVDAKTLDFHLHPDSPLRDRGMPPLSHEGCDFEGDPRVAGISMDIGADELFPLDSTLDCQNGWLARWRAVSGAAGRDGQYR